MNLRVFAAAIALALTGCSGMEPQPAQPAQPKLAFSGSMDGDLVFYNDPAPPAPNPNVQIAREVGRVVLGVAGLHYAESAITGVAGTIANAGGGASTVERTQTVQAVRPEVVQTSGATQVVRPEVITTPPPQVVQPEVVNPQVVRPEVIQGIEL